MHILDTLSLPDRYETLHKNLGEQIAQLLVRPETADLDLIELIASDVRTRREGILIPVFGRTGTGKTTLVDSLSTWLPVHFSPTLTYEGDLRFDALTEQIRGHTSKSPGIDSKIVPINIDHREATPPSAGELAELKRLLRSQANIPQALVFWPSTSLETAKRIAQQYIEVTGAAIVELPIRYHGLRKEMWISVAKDTLAHSNPITDLEKLGADPENYSPEDYSTIGDFLRAISNDFNRKLLELRRALIKPTEIVIAFASESSEPGVLSQMLSPSKYGLLDPHALLACSPASSIGKWWSDRRGLLTRVIVTLNVHAICLAPAAAVSCIRNSSIKNEVLDDLGIKKYGPARATRDLLRSDLGKILTDKPISRYESRGTPASDAIGAFGLLAEKGFNLGKDKGLNGVMAEAISNLLTAEKIQYKEIHSEKKLSYCNLIPDNSIVREDRVTCIEYTWRTGEFLGSSNRSTCAQYIMTKLKNYADNLGMMA